MPPRLRRHRSTPCAPMTGARRLGSRRPERRRRRALSRSRRPAGTPSGSSSLTRPGGESARARTVEPYGWSCSGAAGTWSPTTSRDRTGAASGSIAWPNHGAQPRAIARGSCPPRKRPPSSERGSPAARPRTSVEAVVKASAGAVRDHIGRWGSMEDIGGRTVPPADDHRLARLAGDGARIRRGGLRGGLAARGSSSLCGTGRNGSARAAGSSGNASSCA